MIGRIGFYRGKGSVWIDMLRQWMLPVLGGGASLKYVFRDLEPWQAIALTISVAVLAEIASTIIGWVEFTSGATEEHYRMALESDPHRRDSLSLLEEQRRLLADLLVEVRRRQVVMVRLPEPSPRQSPDAPPGP